MALKLAHPSYRAQQLLFAFGIYRLVLTTVLLVFAFIPQILLELLPHTKIEPFQLAAIAYFVLAILGILVTVNEQLSKTPVTIVLVTDILLLTLILRYSGGVDSGFGSLFLISVGVGGLLLPFQQSLLVAAIAASSVVYTEIFPLDSNSQSLLQAAMLALGYFAETLFLHYVGQRVKTTEQLARAQADTILDLRHLNELIVQRMRTGIIVITADGAIRLLNDSARDALNITDARPFWLNEPIYHRLESWQKNPQQPTANYQVDAEHPEVSVNFAKLQPTVNSDIIVFLEDTGRMNQQAQQLKLASLGRLTASIAHEIRNPLGAISHAAQLIEESENLDTADKRLLSIIHNHTLRVNRIIETILELSRRRPSHIEKVELQQYINNCVQERELYTSANNDQFHLNLSAQCNLEIDSEQIKQVFHNLVENALRYSEQHCGERVVYLRTGQLADTEQFYLDIEDRGEGIDDDQLKHLFEPFYTTENSGTGLGLYIAKELCEANRVQLTYVTGRPGACFRLVFSHAICQAV